MIVRLPVGCILVLPLKVISVQKARCHMVGGGKNQSRTWKIRMTDTSCAVWLRCGILISHCGAIYATYHAEHSYFSTLPILAVTPAAFLALHSVLKPKDSVVVACTATTQLEQVLNEKKSPDKLSLDMETNVSRSFFIILDVTIMCAVFVLFCPVKRRSL